MKVAKEEKQLLETFRVRLCQVRYGKSELEVLVAARSVIVVRSMEGGLVLFLDGYE